MTEDTTPKNLRKFLESDDPALVMMGLSMAKGAGVHEELLPIILRLYMWGDDKTVRAVAKSFFNKYASEEIQAKVKENWKASYRTLSVTGDRFQEAIRPFLEAFKSQDDFALIALEPLIKALEDEDVRYYATDALGKIGDKRAVYPLINILNTKIGVTDRVCTKVVKALGSIGDSRAVEPLIEALEDKEGYVRYSAADALGKIGDKRAIEPLIKLLRIEKWEFNDPSRFHCVDHLVAIGKSAVEPLIKALEDEDVRYYAADALGKIGDKRAIEPLIKLLRIEKWEFNDPSRFHCVDHLVAIGKSAVEPLIKALEDEDVRYYAADALGKIGDKRAVEPLLGILSSDNFYVCRSAAMAFGKLGWSPGTDELKFAYLDLLVRHRHSIEWREIEPLIKTLADEWRVSAKELIKEIRRTITEKYAHSHHQLLFLEEKILNLEQREFAEIIESSKKSLETSELLEQAGLGNWEFVDNDGSLTAEKLIELLSGSSPQARWLVARAIVEIPIDIFWSEISNYPTLITKADIGEIVRIMKILPQIITITMAKNLNNFAMKVSKQKDASVVMKKNGKMMIRILEDASLAKIMLGGM